MKRLPEVTEENARRISEEYLKVYGPILGPAAISEHDRRVLIGPPPVSISTLDVVTRVLIMIDKITPEEEVMVVPEATQENAELLARERWVIDRRGILKYVVTKEWEELNPDFTPDSQAVRTDIALLYLQALRSMLEPRPCGAAFGHPYPGAVCKLKAGHKEGEHECGKLRWKNLVVSRSEKSSRPHMQSKDSHRIPHTCYTCRSGSRSIQNAAHHRRRHHGVIHAQRHSNRLNAAPPVYSHIPELAYNSPWPRNRKCTRLKI